MERRPSYCVNQAEEDREDRAAGQRGGAAQAGEPGAGAGGWGACAVEQGRTAHAQVKQQLAQEARLLRRKIQDHIDTGCGIVMDNTHPWSKLDC